MWLNIDSKCVIQLFLKGEVEQIAMMKPKGQTEHDEGMLEYLEDIIGCGRLNEPIKILCRRVEILNEHRGEKVSFLRLILQIRLFIEQVLLSQILNLELLKKSAV